MTKPNLKLAVQETPQGDTRSALRQAIADKRRADAAVENVKVRLQRSDERIAIAESAVTTAKAATDEVKARAIAAATASDRDVDGQALRASRSREADALDGAEIAVAARAALAAKLPELEAAAAWAANNVIVCANALLAPEAARLLAETRELRLRLAFNEARIAEVFRDRGGPAFAETLNAMIARDKRDAPLAAIKEEASHFLGMMVGGTIEEQRKITARIAEWWQAREATWTDADAPMPEL